MKKMMKLEPVDRSVVERVAEIIGPSSAAWQALTELDRRLAQGENAAIFNTGGSWVVGPAPKDQISLVS